MTCKGQLLPINLPGIGEKLFRSLNLRGGLTASQLTDIVQAGITTLDLSAPEYAWLAREKRYWSGGQVAAVAGQNTQFEVRNNAGSGLLTIIDEFTIQCTAAADIGFYLSTIVNLGLAQLTRYCALDGRQEEAGILSTPAPQTLLFGGTSVLAIPATAVQFNVPGTSTEKTFAGPWVLRPGSYFRLTVGTLNTSAYFRCRFRERTPAPSEL